ncbi:short-subunit dehydrogenase [Stackebrandtia endophytica]|uniref:Short-subunit dehydrogenase n=1 Tax=Stackebrandtia endophytica TaxID=1496996 RepID=A0A543B1Y1_9ACTN|nr:SDR family NAD(P)-dependent oxidoreductase [Stackebrandtia endophytica]TQL78826.1 short-subunit dehydrogenase [Stackebrandtia endophytica]
MLGKRSLAGSSIVITGAGTGLGAATSLRLADEGCRLLLAGRNAQNLAAVARQCRVRGGEAVVAPVDISSTDAQAELIAKAVACFGRIDVWISNAAVAAYGLLTLIPMSDLRRVLSVNLLAPLADVRAVVPAMQQSGGGVIVLVGSVLAETTIPFQGAYTIAKHALLGAAGTVRQELRASGCRSVSISVALPSFINTPLFEHAGNRTDRQPRPMWPTTSVARASRQLVKLVRTRRPRAYLGWGSSTIGWGSRLAPGLTERLLGILGRHQFTPGARVTPGSGNLYEPTPNPSQIGGGWIPDDTSEEIGHGRR